jgi:small subunit ribosomal protein S1
VHVSELSWKHVDHPSEMVTVGQEVDVEVLDVELERERVSLSLKATQEDPWREFERKYQTGEVISGQITKLVPFGAFVRVGEGIEGLVHISELADEHVESPEQVVQVGDQVRVKVVDVDVSRRRISLSIKRVGFEQEVTPEPEIEAEEAPEPEPEPEMESEPAGELSQLPQPSAETAAVVADAEVRGDESSPEAFEAEQEPEPAAPEVAAVRAEPAAPVAPAAPAEEEADEEISLEAILEDLKRREGRAE